MKAQSYYSCGVCGTISKKDAGARLSSCPDCGNGSLKILVPVDDEMKSDPLSGRKKKVLATLIGLAGFASITAFLLFGRLLQGYMTFDAGRDAAEKAHKRMLTEIQTQEESLSSLTKNISESERRKSALAEIEARYATLTSGISQGESEKSRISEALKNTNLELATLTGAVTGRKVENESLKRERNGFAEEIALAIKKLDNLGTEVKNATEAVRQIELSKTSAKNEVEETQKALQRERLTLTNETTRVAGVRNELTGLENDLTRMRNKTTALASEDVLLTASIDYAVSHTNRLASGVANAEKAKIFALAELAQVQADLEVMNATQNKARNKAKEESDAHSERMASLTARVEALETHISEMVRTEATLGAAISELNKQKVSDVAEAAKARAALDNLNAERDKAKAEADMQSARLAALKIEVLVLEKNKAEAEKE